VRRREFIALLGGAAAAWRAAQQGGWMRRITVQVMAGTVLFLNWTIAVAETAAVPSDYKFLDELVSDLGFQPSELIERVRYLANIPSEAPMQHRFSYCVQGYADRIATDAKLREKVVSEVEERTCAQLGLCQERGQQQIDQSLLYAELLRVLAGAKCAGRSVQIPAKFFRSMSPSWSSGDISLKRAVLKRRFDGLHM
jgi:hypothetical protein